jgi:hypothetical protein
MRYEMPFVNNVFSKFYLNCYASCFCYKITVNIRISDRTVFGFQFQFYASTGHLKTRPFEIRTFLSRFRMAILDHFVMNKIFFMALFFIKQSRLVLTI